MSVLRALRHAEILAIARSRGAVEVGELTRRFGVSGLTIRRDLATLVDRGLLDRVHGGAVHAAGPPPVDPGPVPESTVDALVHAAVGVVRPGSAVGLCAGPRAARLAADLATVPGLTVVTPSLPAAVALGTGGDRTVILVGGVRTSDGGHAGPVAVETLRRVNLDVVLLDATGVSERTGYTVDDPLTAGTDRAMLCRAARTVVVADHTSWGRVGVSTVAALSDVDTVVTDVGMPARARAVLADRVRHLVVADRPAAVPCEGGGAAGGRAGSDGPARIRR